MYISSNSNGSGAIALFQNTQSTTNRGAQVQSVSSNTFSVQFGANGYIILNSSGSPTSQSFDNKYIKVVVAGGGGGVLASCAFGFKDTNSFSIDTNYSHNISSINRTATGNYEITFTNAIDNPIFNINIMGLSSGRLGDRFDHEMFNASGTKVYSGAIKKLKVVSADAGDARDVEFCQIHAIRVPS